MLNKQEEEFMVKEEEKLETDSEESSEYEEYTDSEEETGKYNFLRNHFNVYLINVYIVE